MVHISSYRAYTAVEPCYFNPENIKKVNFQGLHLTALAPSICSYPTSEKLVILTLQLCNLKICHDCVEVYRQLVLTWYFEGRGAWLF